MSEIILTDENFEKEVLESEKIILVDFWAEWCMPCKMLTPVIEEIAKEYEGKIRVGKLNVDKSPQTAGFFAINAIPALILFKGKDVLQKFVGFKTKEELSKIIDEVISEE
jgi:thioredoxin 1